MVRILTIISGGQTGADQGALKAAQRLGLATGGWMPHGFLTLDGPRPDLAKEFCLQEHRSLYYPPRTLANVRESDGTIRFARDFHSCGEICTLNAIRKYGKPWLDIDINGPLPVEQVRAWLEKHKIRVLNVAGNPERSAPGIEAFVIDYLVQVLQPQAKKARMKKKRQAQPDKLRLEGWLAKHRPRFYKGLLPPAMPAELDALQLKLGLPLPDDLRTLLSWHNGQSEDFIGKFEQDWCLMSTTRIASARKELDKDAASTGWQQAWIPFLDDDAGNYLCLDTSLPGAPVREFWVTEKEHGVIAPTLAAWLEDFVNGVERGIYVDDPERGTFLRKDPG